MYKQIATPQTTILCPLGGYKVGETNNIQHCTHQLDVQLPFNVKLITEIPCDDWYVLERELHNKFQTQHLNGLRLTAKTLKSRG